MIYFRSLPREEVKMTQKKHHNAASLFFSSFIAEIFTDRLVLLTILIFISINACSSAEDKKTLLLTKGESYFNNDDFFMARLQFKRALQIDPNITEAYYKLGVTEVHLGNVKQALSNFLRVLELNPKHSNSHIQIGSLMLDAGFPKTAIQRTNFVLATDENHRKALKLKASALLKFNRNKNNTQMALQIFEQLLRSGDTSADIYYQSATALFKQSNIVQAQVRIAEGLSQNPQDSKLNELLAKTYLQQNKRENAIHTYQKLVTIDPKDPAYVFDLAELLWGTNRKQQAKKLLAKHTLLIGAKDESVWIRLSHFYAQKNKIDLSFNTLQAGLSAHPESFKLHLTLARRLIEKKDYVSVIKQLHPGLRTSEMKPGSNINDAKLLLSKSFLAIGELNQAKKYSDAYLKEYPQNEEALFIKGMIDLINNDPRNATSKFWSILETNPLNDAARIQLACAMTRTNQWQKAIEILTEGLVKSENDITLHHALFQTHLQQKNYVQAEIQLNELLSKNPDDLRTIAITADFYQLIGAREKAEKIYIKTLDNQPPIFLPYIELSKLYAIEKNYDKALKQLKKGHVILPESKEILLALTEMCIKTGKYESAVNIVKKRLEKNPQDAFAFLIKGKIYASMREYEKSERAYQKAIHLKPKYTQAHTELMELWYRQKKKNKITTYYNSLIRNTPNTIYARAVLAEFYIKEHTYPKAIELYESIIEKNPAELLALNLIGLMCTYPRSEQDLANALTLAKEALQNNPANPVVLDMLGWAYYHNGDLNRAQGYLYRSLDIAPDEPMTLFHLAKVTLEVGQFKKAAYALERALVINEDFSKKEEAQKILKDLLKKIQFQS